MTDLFSYIGALPSPPKERAFHGATYQASQDHARLTGQLLRVFELMSDHRWRTLREIADAAGGSEASVSARLRDLRKEQYGGHAVEARRVARGLWQYRVSGLCACPVIEPRAMP